MALQVALPLDNGLTAPEAYVQIDRFVRNRDMAEIHFNVYANAAARQANANPIYYPPVRLTDPAAIAELEGYMAAAQTASTKDIERCYLYLKEKVAAFAQATDV